MKKFVVLSLVGLLILAFGTAYAQEKKAPVLEFKASGFIDAVTEWYQNIASSGGVLYGPPAADFRPGGAAFDRTNAWVNSRARLKFDAIMGKEMSGTIFFEMDSTRWGEVGAGRNNMGNSAGAADQVALEIKNVYIDFGVPLIPIPITMRVGLQGIGIRPVMLLSTDAMGITAGIKPIDPLTIGLIWGKYFEGKDATADDSDIYGVTAAFKVGTITVGGYGLNYHMNSYPNPAAVLAYGAGSDSKAAFWWLGAYLDGKMGPVNINFDFVYDIGTVEDHRDVAVRFGDVDYKGWASRLKVAYPWEKFTFGLAGMYASGANTRKTSATGLPAAGTTKVGSYVTPPSSEQFGAQSEDIVFYGTFINRGGFGNGISNSYTQVSRGAYGGTWFAKLFAALTPTPSYKVTLQGLYIGDTTKNGNTIGNAVKSDGTLRDDKGIGFEVDLINEIQIYNNLKWNVGLGMLFAGDALDYRVGATNTNDSVKNPWNVVTSLVYTF